MSTKPNKKTHPKNRIATADTYHHGLIEETIIAQASEIYLREGIEKLGVRRLMREVGVSPMAFYHHFKDYNSLIARLTGMYLMELEIDSREMAKNVKPGQESVYALGEAYIWFAHKQPKKFQLIFNNSNNLPITSDWQEIPVYRLLVRAIIDSIGPAKTDQEIQLASLSAWSLVHGLATLLTTQIFSEITKTDEQTKGLIKSVLRKLTF